MMWLLMLAIGPTPEPGARLSTLDVSMWPAQAKSAHGLDDYCAESGTETPPETALPTLELDRHHVLCLDTGQRGTHADVLVEWWVKAESGWTGIWAQKLDWTAGHVLTVSLGRDRLDEYDALADSPLPLQGTAAVVVSQDGTVSDQFVFNYTRKESP